MKLIQLIDRLHKIMDTGFICQCKTYHPLDMCTCCKFDSGLNNWIGLLPYEKLYLQRGDTEGWEFIEKDGIEGIICHRDCNHCTNRPSDCKWYPYMPMSVKERGGETVIEIIAGFPKCPLGQDKSFNNDAGKIDSHMWRIVQCAKLLHDNGLDDWMLKTALGFKGYNEKITLIMPTKIQMNCESI